MAQKEQSKQGKPGSEPITIKKYANRRLYNTATSSYVTLDHLCQMVKEGIDFVVYDAKTNDDITRSVLTQIIVEEESKGTHLLPINFLRQLISFYGDSMQWMVPRYLEQMMGSLSSNQERLRKSMQETLGGMFPTGTMEEMSKQNMAWLENAMRMFAPFAGEQNSNSDNKTGQGGAEAVDRDSLAKLRQQVDQLQKQLDQLSRDEK